MVAEPGKVLAPAAPPRPKPWMVILALFLIMIGDGVEPVDDIMYEEVNLVDFPFENLETEQDVTKDERDDKDWCPVKDGLDLSHSSVMDFEVNFMRCIGATEILAVEGPWANGQLKAEPMERGSTSRVEDWRSDSLDFEDFNTETVRDWGLDQTVDSFESFTQNKSTVTDYFLRYAKVVENAIGDLVFDLERYSATLQVTIEDVGWDVYLSLNLFLLLGAEMTRRFERRSRTLVPKGHLSRTRRWNGGLRHRFEFRILNEDEKFDLFCPYGLLAKQWMVNKFRECSTISSR